MSGLFQNTGEFNDDISSWDTGNVISMSSMFANAVSFNQDISSWNVGKVSNFMYMFKNASSFDQDIFVWNVGENVQQQQIFFTNMFDGATQMISSASVTPTSDVFNQ